MIPVMVAHRGYPANFPENTLVGIRAAVDAGACYVEFDVQMCADGEFVVMHDENLLRTCGVNQCVFDVTLAECMQSSAHEPARYGEKYFPEPVPSFKQVLDLVAAYPALNALVEIKEESLDRFGVSRVMQKLIGDIGHHANQCVVISFSEDAIAYVRQHSNIRNGWVLHRYDEAHREIAERLRPDYLICNQRRINTPVPWPGDWQWVLYGVETAQSALDWGSRGVAFLETDHVQELMRDKTLGSNTCHHG